MDIAYSIPSMVLYHVFFSCLATIAMATWKIFVQVIQFPIGIHTGGVQALDTVNIDILKNM